ncbi:bifunctional 4-hydroxy-2-oxoglutarate aldolase/2-dehydro-3-deoxy-phosphogluconate aldolase [Marinimicrococcus flavescens]|uniref:2-dehydro-3-deoxy-phosphogluconate aldolase n=1 Tax=Marinimicrococcus flavescens TaxID=3031815 RepID=A0AAP3XPG3_9PROT|nr:bifunctional 4-hydroxy-2-oxoglutarate aldolase/2-dehydro-3-deoxy-phosphogluconate aldolase [Marinimicrococcus flavescens]
MNATAPIEGFLTRGPVLPVLVVPDAEAAVPLARALATGGLEVLEITLRTEAALEAIRRIQGELPGVAVGAGTVLNRRQMKQAMKAGAAFAVSPGTSEELLDASGELGLPLLPGVATASEAMALLERGLRFAKFFPAGPAGGPAYLKSLADPLPELRFCPTGGIDAVTAVDYLRLPNVVCVGGSWVAPKSLVAEGSWDAITRLARDAAGLRRS